jgi:putative MATE family efflux protein
VNEVTPIPASDATSASGAGASLDTMPGVPPTRAADGPLQGDLTQGPILRTLLAFSIPTLIANMLQTLNGSVNTIWVGRLIGESALAATANANVVMFLSVATVFGFGMATTVRVGQYFGARDLVGARMTFGSGLGFCLAGSILIAIAGTLFSEPLLRALSTPAESLPEALAYLQVVFATLPLGVVSMMTSMGLRGAGDSKTPLYAMILTVMLDICLNPLLIRGFGPIPALGIAGSAMSTALANFAGSVWMISTLYRKDLPLRLRGSELLYLIPRRAELSYILAKGLPMGAQMLVMSSAGLVMIGLVNREGLNATAAYGASMQLWNYLQMPAMAIGSAVSAMVAQALGAGKHKRVGDVTLVGMTTNLAISISVAAIIVICDRPLLAVFLGHGSPALPIARHIQLICTASFVIISVTMILSGTMRAYGAVLVPLLIMFVSLYPGRIGFYALAHSRLGGEAVWWAYPVSSTISVVLTGGYYVWGNWRKTGVLPKHVAAGDEVSAASV